MTTTKRTIRGERYNVEDLVNDAMANAGNGDLAEAEEYLRRMGHTNPETALVERVARDKAILTALQKQTGAAFTGQLGKIGFDDKEKAIRQVNEYLNRRNAGHRSRWNK